MEDLDSLASTSKFQKKKLEQINHIPKTFQASNTFGDIHINPADTWVNQEEQQTKNGFNSSQ
jgi:hypothetical protein